MINANFQGQDLVGRGRQIQLDGGESGNVKRPIRRGGATNWPGSPLIESACPYVGDFIVGLDARRIDFIWTKIYRDLNWLGKAGSSLLAISAIDIALWDLKDKMLGVPVYELSGGRYRQDIQLYANYWFTGGGHTHDDYARQARETVARGFPALKYDPFAYVNYWYGKN